MKMIAVVALALVAVALAAPVEEPIAIVRSEFTPDDKGGYGFNFEGANGIVREEKGELKSVVDAENKPHEVIVVRGSYSYPSETGVETVNYRADENGYFAEGPSIPA